MKLEDFKKLGPLLLYYETVEEVYQFLYKAHKKEKIFIKEITNEKKKNSLILSIKQEILDDKLIYVDIELPEKKCNTDELLESLHHEINNLKGINKNLEEENKKIRNELKNTIEKFKQDYEKLKEENERIKENNQRLNELFENTKAEYNKRKDNIQQILIPKIFDKLLTEKRLYGIYTRTVQIFEKDYYGLTTFNRRYEIILIGYDNDNYYLYKFLPDIGFNVGKITIRFPFKFQFFMSTEIYGGSGYYYSIGSSTDDFININSITLQNNSEKTVTISELTVLPKYAYHIVLPDVS